MSIVKSNKFSPQSLPIVQIDGFNEVESFVVDVSQTSFTSSNFDSRSQVRAFRYNSGIQEWEELTVVFTTDTDFEIFEGVSDGDEFLVFYIAGYYQNDESIDDVDVILTSTNTVVSSFNTLKLLLDSIGESALLESFKKYGLGSTDIVQIDDASSISTSLETGIYFLQDSTGIGILLSFNDNGSIKQILYPSNSDQVLTRDNSSGSFSEFKVPGKVEVKTESTGFTLSLTDQYKYIRVTDSAAVTATIPDNATVAFPIGTSVDIIQAGTGQLSIAGAVGVTINTPSTLDARAQYSALKLIKVGTDEWDLMGDVA